MRNILAITLALMIATVLLMPAMGYTIKSPGNQSYSIVSGPRVNYSISMGIAAHNLTQEMIAGKGLIMPAVTARTIIASAMASAGFFSTKVSGCSLTVMSLLYWIPVSLTVAVKLSG